MTMGRWSISVVMEEDGGDLQRVHSPQTPLFALNFQGR
jgi:hypothetical protein